MENSGDGPISVPGFGNMPFDLTLPPGERFAHCVNEWEQVPAVTKRELVMVAAMNLITDKPTWSDDIFDDTKVQSLKDEAISTSPLMSDRAWAWCLAELRDKALSFRKESFVRVLDTGSCVCKSDTLVPDSVATQLKQDLESLYKHATEQYGVHKVVDPSQYPLVYGKSLVLDHKGQVDLLDPLDHFEQGNPAPSHPDPRIERTMDRLQRLIDLERDLECTQCWVCRIGPRPSHKDYYWSPKLQRLPCEVAFVCDSTRTEVRITSYVNSLHPRHTSLYQALGTLLSRTIQLWNECLIKSQADWYDADDRTSPDRNNQKQRGRVPLRMVTYGVEWDNELPAGVESFNNSLRAGVRKWYRTEEKLKNMPADTDDEGLGWWKRHELLSKLDDYPRGRDEIPKPTTELWKRAQVYLTAPEAGSQESSPLPEDWKTNTWERLIEKYERVRRWRHPEPGTAVSYDEWKTENNNHKPIVEMLTWGAEYHCWDSQHSPTEPEHVPYEIHLEDTFRETGLQVIVEIGSIDVTPNEPKYPGSRWQLSGKMNEHVVATAIYAFDVDSITDCSVSLRQEIDMNERCYQYRPDANTYTKDDNGRGQRPYWRDRRVQQDALAESLGFTGEDFDGVDRVLNIQDVGSVKMREGPLITFPNVMEYRFEPFDLVDDAETGHFRYVALYLVDPHYRICSTRNVPPQQHTWWREAVLPILQRKGLPLELAEQVCDEAGTWPMGETESEEYKLQLDREQEWMHMCRRCQMPGFNF